MTPETSAAPSPAVRAWDLPTRIFHWTLVALVLCAWVSFEFSETFDDPRLVWHRWNGLALLTVIVWRLLWGIAGPRNVRFNAFVRSPWAAAAYGRDLIQGQPRRFLGHNPLGAYMVLALLAVTGTIGALGLFAVEDNDLATGPLYRLAGNELAKVATGWHRYLFEPVLLVLIGLHVAANVLYGVLKKDPLIPAMVTGQKPAAAYEDATENPQEPGQPVARALILLAVAALIVFGGIWALGGRFP